MSKQELSVLRHSAAHLLAHAVQHLFPQSLFTIGPATEDGFFYDVLPVKNFKEEDLPLLEAEMKKIAAENYPITHKQVSKDAARTLFAHNPFKLELINDIPGDTVGIATQGDFIDLCKGGHVHSTGEIQHFKLQTISGSYWRADKTKQALQRISGTAFFTAEELQNYLQHQEDLIKFDHRRLGKELELFSFHDEGVGFPFFHPKGQRVLTTLTAYIRSLLDFYNYEEISTPIMLAETLWHQSGHYQHYKDNMYFCLIDDKSYAIRPMNCPGAILVYKQRPRSYRELPLKLAEFGKVHRHELSGVLHGLLRVRAFTQDDGHIFCTLEQVESIVCETIEFVATVLTRLEFKDITIGVSTKPKKAMGTDEQWEFATKALMNALRASGKSFQVYEGEGAFYGPKIEFGIKDSFGRTWQCGTIQLDFANPENFSLEYVDHTGNRVRPVMIHRAILGSLERFFAILLEHYKGALPLWLSPEQVRILTITDSQKPYAEQILSRLKEEKIRASLDLSSDQISAKIKKAQLEKIPLMLVIGKKEMEQNTVTLRYRDGSQKMGVDKEQLIELIRMMH